MELCTEHVVSIWGDGNAWPILFPHLDRPSGNLSVSLVGKRGSTEVFHLLIDTGTGCSERIHASGLRLPDLVCLTHKDIDHVDPAEIDTLMRMALLAGMGPLRVVAAEVTWMTLSEYHRSKLTWIPILPDQHLDFDLGGVPVEILAVDAADHRAGGVVFIVTSGTFKFGALFDKRTWQNVNADDFENMDFAVMPANQREPKPTGHVSLQEDLEFLRTLAKPPRFTAFCHYGTEDQEVLTKGSLQGLLHVIAPDLPAVWAHAGFTIGSRYLPPRPWILSDTA